MLERRRRPRRFGLFVAVAAILTTGLAHAGTSVPAAEGPKNWPRLGDAERRAKVTGSRPGKSGMVLTDAESIRLPPLDAEEALLAVEKRRPAGVKAARAVGIVRELAEVRAPECLDGAKHVSQDADGTVAWTLEIRSEGAFGVRAQICAAALPVGAEVICFDADEPDEIYGPLPVPADVSAERPYYTPTVFGEALRLEVRVPSGRAADPLTFVVNGVTHDFVDHASDHDHASGDAALKAGDCIDSVACDSDFLGSLSRAVGRMLYVSNGGSFVCTGQLLNDADETGFTPWFLTANHCISTASEAASLEVLWDYHKPSCQGATPSAGSVPRTNGSTLVATVHKNSGPDASLLRLTGTVPSGRLFAGWSTTPPANDDPLVAIHHPSGEHMRISYGRVASKSADFTRVSWTNGVVLGGSSGSAIYNASRQVVGQLCCGTSSCSNQTGWDDYGRFDRTYSLLSLADHLANAGGGGGGGGGGEPGDDAFDPTDDARPTATALGSPPSGGDQHGPHTLSATDLEDWFAFDLIKGGVYAFESVSDTPSDDLKAQLYDRERGRAVAKDDDGGAESQFRLVHKARKTRTHFLRVRHFRSGSDAAYSLSHQLLTEFPTAPTNVTTKVDRRGRLILKWKDVNKGENGYRVQEQHAGTWTTVAELRKNKKRTKLTPPGVGPRLYRVGPWNARGASYTEIVFGGDGGDPVLDVADPGDDASTGAFALTPVAGGQVSGRSLGGDDAYDWFSIDAVSGTTYSFESTSGADLVVEAYLPGDPTTPIASDDDSGEGLDFRLVIRAPAPGPLLVRVRPFSVSSSVDYALAWAEIALPTTPGAAEPLSPASGGETAEFTLDGDAQELWFVLSTAAGRSYTIESTGTGDTVGQIRRPTSDDLFSEDDDSGDGLNFRLSVTTAVPETFWVRVRAFTPGTTVAFRVVWDEEAAP